MQRILRYRYSTRKIWRTITAWRSQRTHHCKLISTSFMISRGWSAPHSGCRKWCDHPSSWNAHRRQRVGFWLPNAYSTTLLQNFMGALLVTGNTTVKIFPTMDMGWGPSRPMNCPHQVFNTMFTHASWIAKLYRWNRYDAPAMKNLRSDWSSTGAWNVTQRRSPFVTPEQTKRNSANLIIDVYEDFNLNEYFRLSLQKFLKDKPQVLVM